jgi:hypothetical protein
VVDLFKLYTFDFGHIFSRAIVWKKILLYSELLELLQNLRTGPHLLPPASPLCFSAAPPTAHRRRFPRPLAAPFAALPAPPGPQLARPPLKQPRWLLLARTRCAAACPSRHARRRPPAATCCPPARLFLARGRAQ